MPFSVPTPPRAHLSLWTRPRARCPRPHAALPVLPCCFLADSVASGHASSPGRHLQLWQFTVSRWESPVHVQLAGCKRSVRPHGQCKPKSEATRQRSVLYVSSRTAWTFHTRVSHPGAEVRLRGLWPTTCDSSGTTLRVAWLPGSVGSTQPGPDHADVTFCLLMCVDIPTSNRDACSKGPRGCALDRETL